MHMVKECNDRIVSKCYSGMWRISVHNNNKNQPNGSLSFRSFVHLWCTALFLPNRKCTHKELKSTKPKQTHSNAFSVCIWHSRNSKQKIFRCVGLFWCRYSLFFFLHFSFRIVLLSFCFRSFLWICRTRMTAVSRLWLSLIAVSSSFGHIVLIKIVPCSLSWVEMSARTIPYPIDWIAP